MTDWESVLDEIGASERAAGVALPALTAAIGDILTGHLLAVARAGWALDEQRTAVTRELTIGFADLVGYTRASRALAPGELATAIDRFEFRASEVIGRRGGRVVKLIGDEVMFTIEDPAAAPGLATELLDELGRDAELPKVRVGLAAGPVVSHRGDYYGDVVNLAARLVKAAQPGTALVSEEIPVAGTPVELRELKGYERAMLAFELTPDRSSA